MGWEAAIRSSRLTVASAPKNGHSWISAGLLDHRRVPTHWMFSELLARTFPSIEVNSSLLVARDGDIYSSGGIAAGIDLALALLEEDLGQPLRRCTRCDIFFLQERYN
jgi:transcriptional regulator GlxA family with amidase domain